MLGDAEMLELIATWLPPGGRVLDVGCGSGGMLAALEERGIPGSGIDPYAGDFERCRRLTAEQMGRLSGTFDLVYTRYALHHLDEPQQFPWRVRSVLRPAGMLLIVDWVEWAWTGVPEEYFAPQTVVQWVREAGFAVLTEEVRDETMVIAARLRPVGEEG